MVPYCKIVCALNGEITNTIYLLVEQRFNYYTKRRRNRENKRSMVRNMSEYAEYLFQVSVMKCFTFSCYFNINYVPVMLEFENIGVDSLLAPKNLVSL